MAKERQRLGEVIARRGSFSPTDTALLVTLLRADGVGCATPFRFVLRSFRQQLVGVERVAFMVVSSPMYCFISSTVSSQSLGAK